MFFSCLKKSNILQQEILTQLQTLNKRLDELENRESVSHEQIQQLMTDVKSISNRLPNQWVSNIASIATSAGVSIATQQAPVQTILELCYQFIKSGRNQTLTG